MSVARILIVDDDSQIRRALRLLLELGNHDVHDAADGVSGLRLARQVGCDALFCDIFMADQDGLETIQQFRQDSPGVPIVAMSGGGCGGLLDMLPAARSLGADRVMYKPFTHTTLVALVSEILPSSVGIR
jgi:DNA-binding NtrC family response regulator